MNKNIKLIFLFLLISFILFFQIFIPISKADVILGSGVNITNGTIINLSGLNSNITIIENLIVSKLEVYSNYFLINASTTAPAYSNLPYSYNSTTKIINMTASANTSTNLTVNVSSFGEGIKIYSISGYLTSFSWSNSTYNLSLIVNASSGTNSTIEVYWPYSFSPRGISCSGCSAYSYSFNSSTNITTLVANHSSLVTWIMYAYLSDGYSCSANSECLNGYCVHGVCRSSSTYCGDSSCDSGESYSNCQTDCPAPAPSGGGCISNYDFIYPASIAIRKNESRQYQAVINNTGTCSLKLSISFSGIPSEWLSIVPNTSSILYRNQQFTFNLSLSPLLEGNYTITWNLKDSTTKNYTSYLSVVKEEEELKCPICPLSTEWSSCTEGKQKRTNYKCDETTNYACQSYMEIKQCEIIEKPWYDVFYKWYTWAVIGIIIFIAIATYKRTLRFKL